MPAPAGGTVDALGAGVPLPDEAVWLLRVAWTEPTQNHDEENRCASHLLRLKGMPFIAQIMELCSV